ncbi:MAG TPA: polysaccharide deacetylase family protein [Actinomycetota bacterium]|nr:polysaccharide deacetylase family protein [Actinomycetota bacterium]
MFVDERGFARQMERLSRRVVGLGSGGRGVALTFDDAYRSFFEVALPVLERYGISSTLFVPSGRLGGDNTWDAGTSCDRSLMTPEQVTEAAFRGVGIGSHGHRHVDLTAVAPEEARADLAASIEALTALTGRRPRFLAYPWGRHDERVRALAAELGFEAAYAVERPSGDRFGRERVQVEADDGALRFALKASGAYGRLRSYRRTLTSTKASRSTSS